MAHAGVIDRKALQEYKRLLKDAYSSALVERVQKLEELMQQGRSIQAERSVSEPIAAAQDPGLPIKTTVKRWELSYQTLEELAISRFERQNNLLLERRPRFTRGNAGLQLDAIRQDDDLSEDIIVEVRWLRKRYLDGPIWVRQVEAATSTYELISGRKARGILIFVVPKDDMKSISDLPWTSEELPKLERKPEVVIYTYEDLGFVPDAITSDLFASNIKPSLGAA